MYKKNFLYDQESWIFDGLPFHAFQYQHKHIISAVFSRFQFSSIENFRTFCTLDKLLYTVELYTHSPKIIFNYYYYGRTEQIHRCVLFRNKLILWYGGFSISSNLHTKYSMIRAREKISNCLNQPRKVIWWIIVFFKSYNQ